MANNNTYTTTIFLNDEQAVSKLDSLRKSVEQYRKAKNQALIDGDDKAFKTAAKQIRECERQMKGLQTTAQQVDHVLANLSTASADDLRRTIKAINKELSSGNITRGTKQWDYFNQKLRECKAELKGIQAESAAAEKAGFISRSADFLNKNWGAITQFLGSLTTLTLTIRQATQAYTDMEESMANVRKYTGQTSEEVHSMNEEFKQIDTRTSREQLNELAGAAGRLGITSHDSIMEFIDAADKINVALGDDLGKGAVDQIGKLAMAFGEDDRMGLRGAMLATGSAVNELAQNSSASAGYLVDFSARLSGIGKQAGMTQAQIMGLGSVMDENMQRDEMASTAISNIIGKLATDSSKFAKIAGLDAKNFADLVKNDMNGALLTLFDTLNRKGGLMQLAPMFADMGLDGSRAVGVLTVLADKVDDVRRNQEIANDAYREGTSVISEFDVQNTTVQAGIDKAKKRFNDLTVELGERLLPVVKYTITTGSLLVKTLSVLTEFLYKHVTAIASLTIIIGTYTVAMKIANAQSKLSATLHAAMTVATTAYKIATNRLERSIVLTAAAQKILNNTIKAFPGAWLVTAVSAIVVIFINWQKRMADTDRYARELKKDIANLKHETDEHRKSIQELLPVAQDETKSTHERKSAIDKLRQILPDYFKGLDIESAKHYKVADAIDAVNDKLLEKLKLTSRDAQMEYLKAKADFNKNNNGAFMPGATGTQWVRQAELSNLEALRKKAEAAQKAEEDLNRELFKQHGGMNFTNPEAILSSFHRTENSSTYKTEAQQKAEEKARKAREITARKAETAALKAKRDADKQERGELTVHLTELADSYAAGVITFRDYLRQREQLQLESIKKRRQIWGEGSVEANQLADDELAARQRHDDALKKLSEDEIEQQRVSTELRLKAMYYDSTSLLYMNEDAVNEALFQNDMDALARRIAGEKAGTEEWLSLKSEMEQRELEHQYDNRTAYEERLIKMEEEYLNKGGERQEQLELQYLKDFHEKELLNEEEYQQARMAIKEKYAKETPTSDAHIRQTARSSLGAAEIQAGPSPQYDTSGADMGVSSLAGIFRIVEYRRQVNEDLKELYGDDYKNSEAYNEAKRMNNQAMLEDLVQAAGTAYNSIGNILSAASSYAQACSEYETAKIKADYDKQIDAAGNNTKKKEKLEKERDKKIAEAKNKANKKAMKIEVAQAVASTALAAINAYASTVKIPVVGPALAPVAAAVATAAGMLQIATIKKQHQAEAAGYYEGGFTGGTHYRREAGIVHEGEFVANHSAVNNPQLMPALQLIDRAQRNNTVAGLTAADVSRAVGSGGTAVVAPVVNVQTDNEQLNKVIGDVATVVDSLNSILARGIKSEINIDGPDGLDAKYRRYKRLKG